MQLFMLPLTSGRANMASFIARPPLLRGVLVAEWPPAAGDDMTRTRNPVTNSGEGSRVIGGACAAVSDRVGKQRLRPTLERKSSRVEIP